MFNPLVGAGNAATQTVETRSTAPAAEGVCSCFVTPAQTQTQTQQPNALALFSTTDRQKTCPPRIASHHIQYSTVQYRTGEVVGPSKAKQEIQFFCVLPVVLVCFYITHYCGNFLVAGRFDKISRTAGSALRANNKLRLGKSLRRRDRHSSIHDIHARPNNIRLSLPPSIRQLPYTKLGRVTASVRSASTYIA